MFNGSFKQVYLVVETLIIFVNYSAGCHRCPRKNRGDRREQVQRRKSDWRLVGLRGDAIFPLSRITNDTLAAVVKDWIDPGSIVISNC